MFGEEGRIGGGGGGGMKKVKGELGSNPGTGLHVAAGQCCHSNQTGNMV